MKKKKKTNNTHELLLVCERVNEKNNYEIQVKFVGSLYAMMDIDMLSNTSYKQPIIVRLSAAVASSSSSSSHLLLSIILYDIHNYYTDTHYSQRLDQSMVCFVVDTSHAAQYAAQYDVCYKSTHNQQSETSLGQNFATALI